MRADPDTPQNAPAPLVIAVGRWADRAREDGLLPRLAGPRTVTGECLRLSGIIPELAARWWVGDMIRDLASTTARLRAALGEHDAPSVPVGSCPRPDDAGTPCGGQVRARLTERSATCARCHQAWRGEDVMRRLGDALGGAMLDLAGLARYLDDVTVPGLRQWAHRDRWRRERVGARTLYSLTDARASWWARRGPRGVALDNIEGISA